MLGTCDSPDRPRKQRHLARGTPRVWVALALLSIWILASIFAYRSWIHGANFRDFYARWIGARLLLFEGRDLYSDYTTHWIQMSVSGEIVPPDQDQAGFAYPAIIVAPLLPLWLIPDMEVATAVWVGFSLAALVGSLMLLRRLVNPQPHPIVIGLLLGWSFTLLMLYQGQFSGFVSAAMAVGIWAYWSGRERLAGIVASFTLIKPALALLPLAALCALAIRARRSAFITGLAIGLGVLLTLSILLAGWWIPGWIAAVGAYAAYAKVSWPIADAWEAGPFAFAALAATVLGSFVALRKSSALDGVSAAFPLGLLLLPQTLIWELSALVVPLLLAWRGRGRAAVVGIWVLGWLGLLATGFREWWKAETAVVSMVVLLAVAVASRSSPSTGSPAGSRPSAAPTSP